MSHRVVFTPEALDQLADLYQYIAVAASPAIAMRYTDAIVSYCESLTASFHIAALCAMTCEWDCVLPTTKNVL